MDLPVWQRGRENKQHLALPEFQISKHLERIVYIFSLNDPTPKHQEAEAESLMRINVSMLISICRKISHVHRETY